ncbi:MAG: dienelactone hydrolase family protein [Bacteroidia bacterium]|nr:dienelactone hydrolase family protein [Bacteroidia bacterium]
MEIKEINISISDDIKLKGNLNIPKTPEALVIFSHGSGSSRFSPRNNFVAELLNKHNIATLLTDLLTEEDDDDYENRFDIELLTERLVKVTNYITQIPQLKELKVGYFGAITGAACAIKAAAQLENKIHAVVSRGGRPDLAGDSLFKIQAPTLLLVGSLDSYVIKLNNQAFYQIKCDKQVKIIEGASHLFEEPGKLNEVAQYAVNWFEKHLVLTAELNKI